MGCPPPARAPPPPPPHDTRQQLATVTAELETVKNTQLVMNNEMKALREQVAAVTTERDRYRGERDEAVRKLAQATPERDRYGSRERVDAEQVANGDSPPKARRTAPRSR
ncbi:hypothetical protein [Nocardia otitidiscaviarum]|uniref:hypothetical protein n=1 Tax=Nocardia otitidiscaviarum TaxID=1823 RepID=UPI002455D1A0|nr:hypothetical protein [Nocardia otitidiscaviarum]